MLRFVLILSMSSILLTGGCSSRENDAAEPENLRLLTYNVWYGFTVQPERKDAWRAWVRAQEPDIVSLQELNEYTEEHLREDAASWGHAHSVLLKTGGFPTGLTSRFPIEGTERMLEGFHHGLMRVQTAGWYVYVVHLHPSNWETRIREVEQLLRDVDGLPDDVPVILAGDFNTFSPLDSTHYAAETDLVAFFSNRDDGIGEMNLRDGRMDFTPIQMITDAGFVDLEARFRQGFSGTFPTRIEKEGEHGDLRRLDYVFANPSAARLCRAASSVSNDSTAHLSDHYPVLAVFETR